MRAVVLDAPYNFRVEERPLPVLEPGWALLQVRAAGICGSDIHFYTGELPVEPGSVRGHEIAGVVVDPGATGLAKGQSVVVHPLLGCGQCLACQRGKRQLCANLTAIGGQHPGGFAEYVAVPEANLYPFDCGRLAFSRAVMADGVAVAIHAMNAVELEVGESAVVMGDGTIGLLLLQAARARGADPVVLLGKHERNLEIARQLGAAIALDVAHKDALSLVHDAAGLVDVVFEAVGGLEPPIGAGLRMLRQGGRLAVLGLIGSTSLEVPWLDVVLGEKTILGVMGYGLAEGEDEIRQAIDLMESGQVVLDPLITHSYPLAEVGQGFEAMLDRTNSRCIKVVIVSEEKGC